MSASEVPVEFKRRVREAELVKTHSSARKTGRWKLVLECSHIKYTQGTLAVPRHTLCKKCWAAENWPEPSKQSAEEAIQQSVLSAPEDERHNEPMVESVRSDAQQTVAQPNGFDEFDGWFARQAENVIAEMGRCATAGDAEGVTKCQQHLSIWQTYRRRANLLLIALEMELQEGTGSKRAQDALSSITGLVNTSRVRVPEQVVDNFESFGLIEIDLEIIYILMSMWTGDPQSPTASVRQRKLAEMLGVHLSVIQRGLQRLQAANLITSSIASSKPGLLNHSVYDLSPLIAMLE